MPDSECVFCRIGGKAIPADIVFEDAESVAFLDSHPLFPGHVLLCPRQHCETLADLPANLTASMLGKTQLLAKAVESALDAEGSFIAINNRVSQSVPHLHIHIVPRRRKDGLKGFFWPRHNYQNDSARALVREAIAREARKLSGEKQG